MTEQLTEQDEWLSVRDLQRQLQVGRQTAYAIAREIGVKVGGKVLRVDPVKLREWLEQGA